MSGGGRIGFDRALIGVAAVVVLGAIMSILDTTIVNVAINDLSRDFDTSLETIQWVSTGYMLALATVIPLTGWAADRFGTKRLFMTSIALFMAGSILAGLAWSAESLIGFRILQGLGGGMIMPAGMTMLTQAAGPQRVGRVLSVIGVPMILGPIAGPVLGGWLVDDVSWRWIFFINIPIGIVALAMAARILPGDRPAPSERLDWLGLAVLSPGLAALVYGIAETSAEGGLNSARAVVPLVAGAILVVGFIAHAWRHEQPLIDVKLFTRRAVSSAAGTTALFGAALFGTSFLLPLYFQLVRGESAMMAGLLVIPQGLGAALMMPIAGRITDRIGPGRVVLAGLAVVIVGQFGLTRIGYDTSYVLVSGILFLLGLGLGATMMPAMASAYQTLERPQVARATSALNIIQRVAGSIGTAILAIVLSDQLTSRLPGASGKEGLGAAQGIPDDARERLAPVIGDAFAHTFWWSLALVICAIGPALLLSRKKPEAPRPAEAPAATLATES
ncbi:MAG: DHA2 family efflux MFS transporter permease subunit [Thermoleophilia bacterium]